MEKPTKFRNAFSGYHKEDVNTYIKEMDLQHAKENEAVSKKLDSITAESETLRQTVKNTEQLLQQIREQLAAAEAELASKEARIQELSASLQTCQAQLASKDASIDALQSENESLVSTLAEKEKKMESAIQEAVEASSAKIAEMEQAMAATAEETAYKVQMYDKLSTQIGDILLGANRSADDILSSAKSEADKLRLETTDSLQKQKETILSELEKIRTETEADAKGMQQKLSVMADTLIQEISAELHGNIDSCLKEITTCVSELEYDTETLYQTMQNRYREMSDRIQYYQSNVQENIERRLADMHIHWEQTKNISRSDG